MSTDTTVEEEPIIYSVPAMPDELQVLFDRLSSARRATGLYQEDHPIAVNAREAACAALQQALRTRGKLILTASEAGMLADRKAYRQNADTRALAQRLRQRGIQSVTLKPETDQTELATFLSTIDLDPARLRAKGGAAAIMRAAGIEGIVIAEIAYDEEAPPPAEEEKQTSRLLHRREEIIAKIAKLLAGETDEIDEETYLEFLDLLKDSGSVARVIASAVSQADRATLEAGRAAFAGQVVQKIESIVLARSAGEWEQVKGSVRQGVAKLPPAIRPKIFSLQAPTWKDKRREAQMPADGDLSELPPGHEKIPSLMMELARSLAAARGIPRGIAGAAAGQSGPGATEIEQVTDSQTRLGALLEGMAQMRLAPMAPWQEMPDLFQSAKAQAIAADAAAVLLEVLDKEEKLDGYSKVATELERKAVWLMEHGHRAPALGILSTFAAHADDKKGYPAWQRLRAASALQAIGTGAVLQFAAQAVRTGSADQIQVAGDLLAHLGTDAVPTIVDLLGEPLPPGCDSVLAEVLVRMGNGPVPSLAKALQAGYSQAALAIVTVLARLGTGAALQALGRGLDSRDALVRLAVVQNLGKSSHEQAVPLLLPALEDGNASIRRAAIAALGELRSPAGVPALTRIATKWNLSVRLAPERMEAMAALGKIGGGQAIEALGRVLKRRTLWQRKRNEEMRLCALNALKQIGTAECLDLLASFTRDKEPGLRSACLQVFEELQSPKR
jgi:HEAT repeat protein